MTRSELYKKIFPKLIDYLREKNLISEEEKDAAQENFDAKKYEKMRVDLSAIKKVKPFEKMFMWICRAINDNDDIRNSLPARHHTVNEDDEKKLKVF